MTRYEADLIAHLVRELNPKHRVAMFSMKVSPLSDECKAAIIRLAEERGLRVEFTEEPAFGSDPPTIQHFVRAFVKKTG